MLVSFQSLTDQVVHGVNGVMPGLSGFALPKSKADPMESQVLLQVASTFISTPIEASLLAALVEANVADGVSFVQFTQFSEYLLLPAASSANTLGTLVMLRVEDWLREDIQSVLDEPVSDSRIRQQLRIRADELVNQISTLSDSGKQLWFLVCPSTGWIAEQYKLSTLCRTYGNLIATRVRNLSHVTILTWPASLSSSQVDDHLADRLEHIPFAQAAFDQLGDFASAQIVRTLNRKDSTTPASVSDGSTALAAYLSGLDLKIQLALALPEDRPHIDRLLRATASFSLTGEKPTLSDDELSTLLESNTCLIVTVSDRVSNYGPAGLVLFRSTQGAMVITSFALSCTVLGKQVEYAVLGSLAELAADKHLASLAFEYTPTDRNRMILNFLQTTTDRESDTRYVLPVVKAEARVRSAAINPAAWTVTRLARQQGEPSLR